MVNRAILRLINFNFSQLHCLDTLHHFVTVATERARLNRKTHFLVQFLSKKETTLNI